MTEGVITEGKYSGVIRQVVRDIMQIFKYQKEGDWYLPEDMNNGMVYELPPIKFPFTVELELSLDENVETIDVEGEYYCDSCNEYWDVDLIRSKTYR